MKKSIIIFIVIMLITSLLTACGEETVNTPNTNNENIVNEDEINNNEVNDVINEVENMNNYVSTAKYAPEAYIPPDYDMSEHLDIEIMLYGSGNPLAEKYTFMQDELEGLFNVDFTLGIFNSKNADMTLIAAADVYPECGWVYLGAPTQAYDSYMDGLTRTIPMEYIKTYAPWYWQAMLDDKSCHAAMLAPGTEDEYFTLYSIRYNMLNLGSGLALRLDWLNNLGYDAKGTIETVYDDKVFITDEAYLFSEFEDLIYEFTFSDPDMNGENDTYGFNAIGIKIDSYSGTLYSVLDARQDFCEDANGWAVPQLYSEQNYNFFRILGEWSNLGVIGPSYATESSGDLWTGGKAGSIDFSIKNLWTPFSEDEIASDVFWNGNIPLKIYTNNFDAKIIFTPPLLDNDGNGGHGVPYEKFMRTANAGHFFVRKDIGDEKLKRMLLIMDYISTYPTGHWFARFGVEGLHYTIDSKTGALGGVEDQSDLPDNLVLKDSFSFFTGACEPNYSYVNVCLLPPWMGGGFSEDEKEIRANQIPYATKKLDEGVNGSSVNGFCETYQYTKWPTLNYPYIDYTTLYQMDEDLEFLKIESLKAYQKSYKDARTALLNGDNNLDTIWDNLIATLNRSGYQEYLTFINENAFLRDELFYDGIMISPAEKFPME